MPIPRLTFFCELDAAALQNMLTETVLADLAALKASVSLGILDLTPGRAEAVRCLNRAQIPVTAWLLLPKEQGYWFNLDNAPQAIAQYAAFKTWTAEHGLQWDGIGLDIEPDIREIEQIGLQGWRSLLPFLRNTRDRKRLHMAQATYADLVADIHRDGYRVESYQFPVISEERQAGSTLLRRSLGLVDVTVDREVWMLYSSFFRNPVKPNGASLGLGILGSYAPEAQAVGLGSTGGGVDIGAGAGAPLSWEEFARDLRLAWYWCDQLYIFSLEGCVAQGFLARLKDFPWDYLIIVPEDAISRANSLRRGLRTLLWVSAHLTALLVSFMGALLLVSHLRKFWKRR